MKLISDTNHKNAAASVEAIKDSLSPEVLSYIGQLEEKVRHLETIEKKNYRTDQGGGLPGSPGIGPHSLELMVDQHPEGAFALDYQGVFLVANEKFERMCSTSSSFFIGRKFVSLFNEGQRENIEQQLTKSLAGFPCSFEASILMPSGERVYFLLTTMPVIHGDVVEGIFGIAKDITGAKHNEADLKRFFDNASELICTVDMTGRLISQNPAWSKVLGHSIESLASASDPLLVFIHPDDLAKAKGLLLQLAKGIQPDRFEIKMISIWDEVKTIQWSATPDLDKGVIYGVGRDITLQKKNSEFQSLVLESILDYFYVLDRNFHFTYVNSSAEKVLQAEGGGLIGKKIWDVFPVLANSVFYENMQKALATMQPVHFEYYSEVIGAWFDESFYPSEEGVSVFFRSVSDRKKAEKELEDQKYFFEQTFMQSGISAKLLDKDGWCLRINPKLSEMFGVMPDQMEGKNYNIFQDPEVVRRGYDHLFRKVIEEKRTHQWEAIYDLGHSSGALGIPVAQSQEFWLFITAYPILNHEGDVTHLIVQEQDISERKLSEKRLIESETKYRTLIEGIDLGLLEVDNNDVITRAYPKFCEMLGYTENELIGQKASKTLNMQPASDPVQVEKPDANEFSMVRRNGEVVEMIVVKTAIFNQAGEATGALQLHYDITSRKNADRELIRQKELAETILGNIPIMIGIFERGGKYRYVNPYWEKELGWSLDQMQKTPDFLAELYPDPEDREAVLQNINAPGFTWKDSVTLSRTKGQIHTSWINVPLSEGLIIGIGQNITQRKEAEMELKASNERFEFVTKATFDAIWDTDLVQNSTYWGEGFKTLFGYSPEELSSQGYEFKEYLHPSDQDRVHASFQSALAGAGLNWIDEYRFRTAFGNYAYVQDKAIIIRNAKGKAVRAIGAIQDITRLKSEELRLKLLESVITNSTDSILIAETTEDDPLALRVVYVNAAFTNMSGYGLNELLGKSRILFFGPTSDDNDYAKLNHALQHKHSVEFETLNYRKNGEEYWVYLSFIPVTNTVGHVTHWISIQRDTTGRKKRELEREQLVNQLTRTNKELKQFSYITSHNMRSPLTNLLAIVDLLDASKIEDPVTLELLQGFRTSTQDLNNTMNDLIHILFIKENQNVERSWVLFEEVNQKVQRSVQNIIAGSNALIHSNFSNAEGVEFNPAYMESIFLNLITNSVKYARKDSKPVIFIYSMVTDDSVQLVFEDNGLGFNMSKVQNKIFGLYQKFHNHPDSKGIGLYLVHAQVTSLGGSIKVESEENEGTKFTISFPLK